MVSRNVDLFNDGRFTGMNLDEGKFSMDVSNYGKFSTNVLDKGSFSMENGKREFYRAGEYFNCVSKICTRMLYILNAVR